MEGASGEHGPCVVHIDKIKIQNCILQGMGMDVSLPHAAMQVGIQSAQGN